jgi:hypothetical protein
MESAWSNGKAAYRYRHGHTSVAPPFPGRPGNAYVREDRVLPQLPALRLLLTGAESPPNPPAGLGHCPRLGASAMASMWPGRSMVTGPRAAFRVSSAWL